MEHFMIDFKMTFLNSFTFILVSIASLYLVNNVSGSKFGANYFLPEITLESSGKMNATQIENYRQKIGPFFNELPLYISEASIQLYDNDPYFPLNKNLEELEGFLNQSQFLDTRKKHIRTMIAKLNKTVRLIYKVLGDSSFFVKATTFRNYVTSGSQFLNLYGVVYDYRVEPTDRSKFYYDVAQFTDNLIKESGNIQLEHLHVLAKVCRVKLTKPSIGDYVINATTEKEILHKTNCIEYMRRYEKVLRAVPGNTTMTEYNSFLTTHGLTTLFKIPPPS
uniref:Uncharacterized protein n=1 Tax=Rhabditophanes sp. KR3021 TaxID=114890 RepID=A0AC35TK94_9BILA